MAYKIKIIRAAQKQILSLSRQAQVEIARSIGSLATEPRPTGCKKLRATDLWRLRLGRYRVVYVIDDKARLITVIKIAARQEDTYQGL